MGLSTAVVEEAIRITLRTFRRLSKPGTLLTSVSVREPFAAIMTARESGSRPTQQLTRYTKVRDQPASHCSLSELCNEVNLFWLAGTSQLWLSSQTVRFHSSPSDQKAFYMYVSEDPIVYIYILTLIHTLNWNFPGIVLLCCYVTRHNFPVHTAAKFLRIVVARACVKYSKRQNFLWYGQTVGVSE